MNESQYLIAMWNSQIINKNFKIGGFPYLMMTRKLSSSNSYKDLPHMTQPVSWEKSEDLTSSPILNLLMT